MDPVSAVVWGVIGVVLLLATIFALRVFGRLVFFLLGLAVLGVALGLVFSPTETMANVNSFIAQVNQLIVQLKTSLGV